MAAEVSIYFDDEFQDINKIQYEIVKMLAGETKNLFIVGDDDQSIYKFRGARPELMLNFPKDFENTRQVILNAKLSLRGRDRTGCGRYHFL